MFMPAAFVAQNKYREQLFVLFWRVLFVSDYIIQEIKSACFQMWGNTVKLFLSYEFKSLGDGKKFQEGKFG